MKSLKATEKACAWWNMTKIHQSGLHLWLPFYRALSYKLHFKNNAKELLKALQAQSETNSSFITLTTWSPVTFSVDMPTFNLSRGQVHCVFPEVFRNKLSWSDIHRIVLFNFLILSNGVLESKVPGFVLNMFPKTISQRSRPVSRCSPAWRGAMNAGLVRSSVVYYTLCPNKSGSLLSFLEQQQSQAFVSHQPAPNSQNTERQTKEQRGTKVQRDTGGEKMETPHTHTPC